MTAPIAFLTSSNMVDGHADMREDAFEYDVEFRALFQACRARLLRLEPVIWDQPQRPWSAYAAVVVGTTWDYWDKVEAYLATLAAIEAAGAPLFNSAQTVRWNLDKGYLADLEKRGAHTIPTLWRETADPDTLTRAFDDIGSDRIVVKPRIGAGAVRLARLSRGEPMPGPDALPHGRCLIQPYLPSLAERGEVSMMFYDGVFSHALLKTPKSGDFRVQSVYGARETGYEPTAEEHAAARIALAAAPADLLYARVDLVEGLDGRPALIELELIEPYHYPEQGPDCGYHFAAALDRYLNRARSAADLADA